MKKILAFLMAAAIAVSAAGCTIEDSDSKVITDIQSSSEESKEESKEEPKEESKEEPEESKEETSAAKVGQSVEGPNWKISLTSAKTFESFGDEFFTEEPEDGKVYLACFFEVENVSDEDDYFNYFYIESYVDGYNEQFTPTISDVEGMKLLTGDVAAGKKLKGYLAWEVPSDWKELEISYKDDLWTGDKAATFVVTPDQLSK